MSRKGKEWNWYHRGGNKNVRFFDVWCNYCLRHEELDILREDAGLAMSPGDEHGQNRLLELGISPPLPLSLSIFLSSSLIDLCS